MARIQTADIRVDEIVRQEEIALLREISEIAEAENRIRQTEQAILDSIARLRETIEETYPEVSGTRLDQLLQNAELDLRQKTGLIPLQVQQDSAMIEHKPSLAKMPKIMLILLAICSLYLVIVMIIGTPDKPSINQDAIVAQVSIDDIFFQIDHSKTDQATLTLQIETSADEAIIYENTKVIAHQENIKDGDIITKTVFHERGTYVYFVEIFRSGKKTTSDQRQVIFGQENKEGQQR